MVAPIVAFAGLTVAALIKQVVADYTANMAKKNIARSYLIERIDNKLEKKLGKDFLKQKLDDNNLEHVRKVIQEELSAYSPNKDIDLLIVNSAQKLSNEHQTILDKLDKVESFLEKISIPLAYSIMKESDREFPEELLTGLLEGTLQGQNTSRKVLNELTEEGAVSQDTIGLLENFKFIKGISDASDKEISRLVRKFAFSPDEINTLNTLMDISALLIGPSKEIENIVSEFVFKMISEGVNSSIIENSVVSFIFMIQRLGKLDLLSESDRVLLSSLLRKGIQNVENPTRILESYFLLSNMSMASDIDIGYIKDILEQQQKQGIETTNQMVDQLKISGRLARFLRKIGFQTLKPESSIQVINILIRKLDKRKFMRSTQLLKYQIERLTSEMNLLIAYFEKEDPSKVDVNKLIDLLTMLIDILNRPEVFELEVNTKKLVIELMDSTYYLYDLLAIRNSWNLLNKYQLNIKSLYSPTLGSYQRIKTDEEAINRSIANFSRERVKRVEKEFPSPPRKERREKIQL